MKTPLNGPNAMSRIRVFLIATCLLAVTPRLFGDIILVSRLSDAEASACGHPGCQTPPPQSQTGFLPANLCNTASGFNHCPHYAVRLLGHGNFDEQFLDPHKQPDGRFASRGRWNSKCERLCRQCQCETDCSKLYPNGGPVSVFDDWTVERLERNGHTYRRNWDDL